MYDYMWFIVDCVRVFINRISGQKSKFRKFIAIKYTSKQKLSVILLGAVSMSAQYFEAIRSWIDVF